MLFYATGVVRAGEAVLIAGPSGAGKSDLALRLLDRGWTLLADDYVRLERSGGRLIGHAPEATRGLIEVRGFGIARVEAVAAAPVALIVELGVDTERMPLPAARTLLDVRVPQVTLDPRPASAPLVLELAFARALAGVDEG